MSETLSKTRCPLWVKIVLAASLALNLAIVGMAAGWSMRGSPVGGRSPTVGYAMPYIIALPREVRGDVFTSVRGDKGLPNRRARRADYEDMMTALAADPFDRGAVEAILIRQADGAARVQSAAQSKWLDVVTKMPVDARAEYIERIQEVLKRGRKRGGGKKGKP